jgi:3-hydroxyisobutyrate dehydrogenase
MHKPEQSTVGVIGLGSMGLGMAQMLARKGNQVVGFDLRANQREAAASSGVEAADTIDAAFARSDFIVLSLPTAQDVESVVNAHAPSLRTGHGARVVIVDTSTSEPDVSRALAARLDAAGVGFLDAPVSGGASGAASGKLTMMIGGAEADVALARPVIEALSAKVLHVGPSGAGNVAKLVNNLLAAAHMITTSEALRLAAATGIDPEAALRVVNAASGRSLISEVHFPTWIMSDRFDSGFSMALMRKDVRLAQELAQRTGADLPVSRLVGELWASSATRLADGDDFTRMGSIDADGSPGAKKASANG